MHGDAPLGFARKLGHAANCVAKCEITVWLELEEEREDVLYPRSLSCLLLVPRDLPDLLNDGFLRLIRNG